MHWRANMNSFRLTTVKSTMLIYVHSFRLCQPSQKLYLSTPGFVNVQNWKNSVKKLNITIMFPFYNLFKVHYNTWQGCVRRANWLRKQHKFVLNEYKMWIKNPTAYSQNILYVDALHNIKRKKYKTICAELAFAKVTFDRLVMIFFIELVMFSLFAMQLDYCNIQRVFDQK